MGYNQLFLVKPSMEIIIKLINCFELEDLNDKTEFTHLDMDRNNTLCKIRELEEELAKYYLPCKKNIYLNINLYPKRSSQHFENLFFVLLIRLNLRTQD